ncbi:MAG: RNA polymerase sigma factor RpoD/SigA [Fibrobacteres bacterium]|nr:RNA polymerase sigma factor RpoD/SigA [Fibrobacterota bacterium]
MADESLFKNDQAFVNQYLKDIKDFPQLTKEEERKLLEEYTRNSSRYAFDKLTTSNLRFVVSVAVKYQNQGLSMPELINEGNLGLMEAIKRFNPANYSVKFISYAVWWIRQSIIKALYEKSRLVRVSAEKESKMKQVNLMAEKSLQVFGFLNYDYVAEKTHSKPHEIEQILSLSTNRVSLDTPVGDDDDTNIYDLMADQNAVAPDAFLERDGDRQSVNEMLNSLSPQERTVVSYYYGLDHPSEFNLEQIGRKLKISKERVRQIKKRALEKMRSCYDTELEMAHCA